jgi:ubiquinone/menaquinone biosynthesis C-methylase UbiE
LTKQAGLADRISFQEGNAEAIPLDDDSVDVALSFTVMEVALSVGAGAWHSRRGH